MIAYLTSTAGSFRPLNDGLPLLVTQIFKSRKR